MLTQSINKVSFSIPLPKTPLKSSSYWKSITLDTETEEDLEMYTIETGKMLSLKLVLAFLVLKALDNDQPSQ